DRSGSFELGLTSTHRGATFVDRGPHVPTPTVAHLAGHITLDRTAHAPRDRERGSPAERKPENEPYESAEKLEHLRCPGALKRLGAGGGRGVAVEVRRRATAGGHATRRYRAPSL